MRIGFVTLFPEMIAPLIGVSILGRAEQAGAVQYHLVNPRDFTYDRHNKVDDRPYGGAAGMLIKPEPVALALDSMGAHEVVIVTDPAAPLFRQADANALALSKSITFLCGHYEGFDHRVRTELATHAYSIGDYILTNGEIPALAMADAIVRQIPGVLGNPESLESDSFGNGLLSAPNFTVPVMWRGVEVPAVLRSGNHKAIEAWRNEMALEFTRIYRPDLLADENVS